MIGVLFASLFYLLSGFIIGCAQNGGRLYISGILFICAGTLISVLENWGFINNIFLVVGWYFPGLFLSMLYGKIKHNKYISWEQIEKN